MVRPLVPLLPPITTPPDCSCLDCVVIAVFRVQVKQIRAELTRFQASFPQISASVENVDTASVRVVVCSFGYTL